MTTPRFSCVIFDVDGTLSQTNQLIFASFNHVLDKYLGKILSEREIIALFGPPEEGGLVKLLGEATAKEAEVDLYAFYSDNHDAMAYLHSGMKELLNYLKHQGLKLAVFTGKGRRTTEITLGKLGISEYFDVIVTGTEVVHHKPNPEGIQRVMSTLGVSPTEVLMVGDALSDVKASRAAGVKVAAAAWDSYDRDRLLQAEADYVFHSPAEMLSWFKSLQPAQLSGKEHDG